MVDHVIFHSGIVVAVSFFAESIVRCHTIWRGCNRDAISNGEEEVDLVQVTTNLDEEPIPNTEASIFPPFMVKAAGPISHGWFIPPIPKEEEASVEDSITSGLPSGEQNVVAELTGFGG